MGSINRSVVEHGYALVSGAFSASEVDIINEKIKQYLNQAHPGIYRENQEGNIRGIHGLHLYDQFFHKLTTDRRLLSIAREYLQDDCYVHQFKVNVKESKTGLGWPWHQDFVFWSENDAIQTPRLLNIALYLNDVDMANGPLCFIPCSHQYGELSKRISGSNTWEQDISENLSFQVDQQDVDQLKSKHGYEYALGKKGDMFVFHPQVVHCSSMNKSNADRPIMIITYNAVSNTPQLARASKSRPEFLCARDFTPLYEDC
jgi:ectoine hydroxylase